MREDAAPARLLFPALGKLYERLSPYSYAFMRFCLGAALAPHGFQKIVFFRGAGRYSIDRAAGKEL